MKKIVLILCGLFFLTSCGTSTGTNANKESNIASDTSEPREYTYAELQSVYDAFIDEYLEELSKLSSLELNGLSEDEELRNRNYWKVANSIADKVLEECKVPQGQRIIIIGYVGKQGELNEENFFVRQGVNRIFFCLKHKATDNGVDGLICRTDDTTFLELEENTPVKIEATFLKKGFTASNDALYDCEILEIGAHVDAETEALYPTTATAN